MTVQVSNQNLEKNHQFITITVQCASIPPKLCVDGCVCYLFDILEFRHNFFQDEVFGDDGPSAGGASIGIGANASSSASAGNDSGLGADEQHGNSSSSSSNSAGVSMGSAPPQVCYIGIRALMERSLI